MKQTTVSTPAEEAILRAGLVNLSAEQFQVTASSPGTSRDAPPSSGLDAARTSISNSFASTMMQWQVGSHAEIVSRVDAALLRHSDAEIGAFISRASETISSFAYRPPDPVARDILRSLMPLICTDRSAIHDAENLLPARGERVVFISNHLTRFDVGFVDHLLSSRGFLDIANRLNALVSHNILRYPTTAQLSLWFGTIPVPRSPHVSPHSRAMGVSERASAWRQALQNSNARLEANESVLIFPEGGHTDSCAMQRFLPAIARYLKHDDTVIQPVGLWGAKDVLPCDSGTFSKGAVHLRIGKSVSARELRSACPTENLNAVLMHALGFAVASLLPISHRGAYGSPPVDGAEVVAKSILRTFDGYDRE